MKAKLFLAFAISSFAVYHSAFAQGTLTPPGAPVPTMKTLTQIEPRIPISSLPYTITNPGSYYLTTNLTGGTGGTDGIAVDCGNVTIDLSGFTLQGVPGSGYGIHVPITVTNLVFRNGIITGWGFYGIDTYHSGFPRNQLFEHLTVSGNGYGGILTEAGSIVRDCLAYGNASDGISMVGGEIANCVSRNNGGYGFSASVIEIGSGCTLRQCLAEYNTNGGFTLNNSQALDCDSQYNTKIGFTLSASQALDCHSQYNSTYGFDCNGNGNEISRCRVANNGANGIECETSAGGTKIEDCEIANNQDDGIYSYLGGAGGAYVVRNNFISPTGDGISLNDNKNYVEGNRILTNYGYTGIYTLYGTNDVVVRNAVDSGGGPNNYIMGSGNDYGPISSASSATSPWANISH